MAKRVVITGVGMVSPLGGGVEESWAGLLQGKTGFSEVSLFDTSGCRCHLAGQVDVSNEFAKHYSRATRLALPALKEALEQSQLLLDGELTVPSVPWCISTTGGAMQNGEAFFRQLLKQETRLLDLVGRYQPQQQIIELQRHFKATGHASIVANACASGGNAIGQGRDWIQGGFADCMIVGGYEALAELIFVGFDCLQATSTSMIHPFDQNRDGLLLGEGAGFLVLESVPHALKRGVKILAEVTGYGHTTDLTHLTRPQPEGETLVRAIRQAQQEAVTAGAGNIGYVNAHGTATLANDGAEATSLLSALGVDGDWKVNSTKASTGHTLGAAGALEAIFALQSLRTGDIPLQVGSENPIAEIEPHLSRNGQKLNPGDSVASTNLGFGGSNACLIFSEYQTETAEFQNGETGQNKAELNVCVHGFGRVHPADTDEPVSEMASLVEDASPHRIWRVASAHPALEKWKRHPRFRRSTPLARFLVAACDQALASAARSVATDRMGLIAALGTGSIQASRKFYQQIIEDGQAMASPAVFPETVYNSPVSHVAAGLGIDGPVDTIVGDESTWVTALTHASTWLKHGKVDAVLVCAGEELDAVALEAYRQAGWYRRRDFLPAEGAAAVLLQRKDQQAIAAISNLTFHGSHKGCAMTPYHANPFAFTCSPAWETVAALKAKDLNRKIQCHGSNFQYAELMLQSLS